MKRKLKDGMYVRSAKDAETSRFVTAGKAYKVSKVDHEGLISFNITGDNDNELFCLLNCCSHLREGKWEIVENKPFLKFDKKYYYYLLHLLAGISLGYLLFA